MKFCGGKVPVLAIDVDEAENRDALDEEDVEDDE